VHHQSVHIAHSGSALSLGSGDEEKTTMTDEDRAMEGELLLRLDVIKDNERLSAELTAANARIEHMSKIMVESEELLDVEETGELILRPIERLRAELASRQIDVETFSEANRQLRAELTSSQERISELYRAQKNTILSAKSVEYNIDALRATAHQDAENRAADIEAAEQRGYDCGVNDITRQDAEENARLRELVKEALQSAPPGTGFQARCRAALACRPQPARNRPLPETRCDCCDNGLDDAWEFCPFCGQQHPAE
jgi:hypothetical protein